MSESASCATCGAPLDGGAPDGLCAACLFGVGAAPEDTDDLAEVDVIAEKPGDQVGSYLLKEQIGQGAFGVVFRAEQERPVRREVALKVIKPGMDSKEVVTRFEAERQALAVMNHPHIAKVHDAGTTERGRPYFVMELVDGLPLTEFCNTRDLGMRERLELFVDLCEAVQHAHQKGIIHRDLKPGNILVSMEEDGTVRPKVIDFGVAKAVNMELTDKTFFTVFGQMMGTPQYMSPEQTDLNAVDVDTRSDIYSLGVLLYELVTGKVPIESEKLTSASFDEMRRLIREEEPPRPSTRVGGLDEGELQSGARERGVDPGRFRRYLQGDLDWVVMKALEKDRTRRYETAQGLANDVRNFLDNQPVTAGPPGAAYQVRKFVSRHRGGVLVSALVLLMLVVGFIITNNERLATEAALDVADVALDDAEAARLAELEEKKSRELEHVKWLLGQAWSAWEGQPGSRRPALEWLEEVGNTDLSSLGASEELTLKIRSEARNALFACMLVTDMEEQTLWTDLPTAWVPVAVDAAHKTAVLGLKSGCLEVREVQPVGEDGGDGGAARVLAKRDEVFRARDGLLLMSPAGDVVVAALEEEGEGWVPWVWHWKADAAFKLPARGVGQAFDFLPEGKGYLLGSTEGELKLFGPDGVSRRSVSLEGRVPHFLRVRPDGAAVAVVFDDGGVEVISLEDELPRRQAWQGLGVTTLAWSPGKEPAMVAGTRDGSVLLLREGMDEGALLRERHTEPVEKVAWSHDGQLMASACGDEVWLWDARQLRKLTECSAWAQHLSFSEDDRTLGPVTPEGDTKGVAVLEVQRSEACLSAMGHPGCKIIASTWLWDGGVLVTGAADGLRFWNTDGAMLAHRPGLKVNPGGIVADRDSTLYLAMEDGIHRLKTTIEDVRHRADGSVISGRLKLDEPIRFSSVGGGQQLALSKDNALLAVAHDREVVLIDVVKGEQLGAPLDSPQSTAFISLSPDMQWLAAGTSTGSGVRIWNLADLGRPPQDLPVEGAAPVSFFPLTEKKGDGKTTTVPRMLLTGDSSAYRLWRLDEKGEKWVLKVSHPNKMENPRQEVAKMAFSPRGTVLVVSYNRNFLQILDPLTLTVLAQPKFDEQWPLTVDPDGRGRRMATEATDGRFFIWDFAKSRDDLAECGLDWPFTPFENDLAPVILP